MKLIFTKEEEDIKIQIVSGTVTENFDYVKMIQSLIENDEIEESNFGEGISEEEQDTINAMLQKIREAVLDDDSGYVEEGLEEE